MATVKRMLDDLVAGRTDLSTVVADFGNRTWPAPPELTPEQMHGTVDIPPSGPNSIDQVDMHPGLSWLQREALRMAYDRAIRRQVHR